MKKVLLTTLLYAALGPPIGAVFLSLLSFGSLLFQTTEMNEVATHFKALPFLIILGIGFSYWLGGLQAMFVGLLTGAFEHFKDNRTIWIPLAGGFLTWLYYSYFVAYLNNGTLQNAFFSEDAALWFAIHMISAGGVWFLQRWWRKRQPT
jgi:hypothetical protein